MMKGTYQGVRVCGPLASHADGFYSWLVDRRFYSTLTAVGHLRLVAHMSRWLVSRDLDCAALTEDLVLEFVAARRAAGYRHLRSPRALPPLLAYLREVGAAPKPVSAAVPADLLQSYRRHLTVERQLVAGSVDNYVQLARRFLDFCAQQGVTDLAGVKADQLSGFVMSERARRPSGSARHAVTPLRALLRFGQLRGLTGAGLAMAVPRGANSRGAGLPRSLALRDVTRLLASCDRRTRRGRRDYAMLLMLARLGLRAGELAALRLDDVDWRAGRLPASGPTRDQRPPLVRTSRRAPHRPVLWRGHGDGADRGAPRWCCRDGRASTSAHGRGRAAPRRRANVRDLRTATASPASNDGYLCEG
jgi:site-specific recombinase XerD